ncbi:MAG: PASTA domain-containing protein [Gemmatimonadetes bacterium]|nr:PASTA domain-containing protein [Gemmatimonadota bacterium]
MKFRRHVPESVDWTRLSHWRSELDAVRRWRRYVREAGVFAVAALIGYLVAALFLFRAPIFAGRATVPRVIGLSVDSARAALSRADLSGKETERIAHPRAPAGQVVWQDPPPEMVVTQGNTVDLSVSGGPQRAPVPDIAGYDGALARLLIENAGLAVAVESVQTAAPRGVAVNSRPPAGTAVVPGTRVTLVVSTGAPTITVPDLIGLTLEGARTRLEAAGLAVGTSLARQTTTGAVGTVIEQRPAPGTLSAPGTRVDLTIARRGNP